MAYYTFLKSHRAWEDWTVLGLGVAIIISPAIFGASEALPLFNAIVVGFLLVCIALSELSIIEQWGERGMIATGAWLMASPLLLVYSGPLAWVHAALGLAVIAFGALELWQDRE